MVLRVLAVTASHGQQRSSEQSTKLDSSSVLNVQWCGRIARANPTASARKEEHVTIAL